MLNVLDFSWFIWIYLISPDYIWVSMNLSEFSWFYLILSDFSWIHLNLFYFILFFVNLLCLYLRNVHSLFIPQICFSGLFHGCTFFIYSTNVLFLFSTFLAHFWFIPGTFQIFAFQVPTFQECISLLSTPSHIGMM